MSTFGKSVLGAVVGAIAGGGFFVALDVPTTGFNTTVIKYRWVEAVGGAVGGTVGALVAAPAGWLRASILGLLTGVGGGAVAHEIRIAARVG